jgi:lipoate---protein ligase
LHYKNKKLQISRVQLGLDVLSFGHQNAIDIAILNNLEKLGGLPLIRFYNCAPCVAIGRNQQINYEVRTDFCDNNDIDIVKRNTMGGAIYLDNNIECLSFFAPKQKVGKNLQNRIEYFANLIISSLAGQGLKANFKLPNDIETLNGQKIGSVFIIEKDNYCHLFASIIISLDLEAAMKALLVPTEKLTVTGLEFARQRMSSIMEVTENQFEIALFKDSLFENLRSNFANISRELSNEYFSNQFNEKIEIDDEYNFTNFDKCDGGSIRVSANILNNQFEIAKFNTDAQFSPFNFFEELESKLKNAKIEDILAIAQIYINSTSFDGAQITKIDVLNAIRLAIKKYKIGINIGFDQTQIKNMMMASIGDNPESDFKNANVVLVPYCAKPSWCKWRETIDCVECSKCEVSDAYKLARENNFEIVTILNYEHLMQTFEKMKKQNVTSYIGMCCGEFFNKRHKAFREAKMSGFLMDIIGSTCYELNEEHLAYSGNFKAQAKLDKDSLSKIMNFTEKCDLKCKPNLADFATRPHENHAHKVSCHQCQRKQT